MAQIASSGLVFTAFAADKNTTVNGSALEFDYLPLHPVQGTSSALTVPSGKRVPFGWEYFALTPGNDGLVLEIEKKTKNHTGTPRLRLMVALDTRDEREVEVSLAKTGEKIGTLSIWYASALQLFECELQTSLEKLQKQGLRIRLTQGREPIYFLATTPQTGSHLGVGRGNSGYPAAGATSKAFLGTFCSLRSLHPFGWMEGCSLDGLLALSQSGRYPMARAALDSHLKLFVLDSQNLVYENPNTQPSDNQFNNVESGLPFVAIADKYPKHPSIKLFTDFCERRIENGQTKEGSITTEGCYTLAYPLAVVASATGHRSLYEYALIELEERIKYLTDDHAVYQRAAKDGSTKGFRNWGRGYTWFLLGLVRTATVIGEDKVFARDARLKRIREAYVYYAQLALRHQQSDHSWRGYLDLPETPYDSSATAGLGAALLYGQRVGWLPELSEKHLMDIRLRLKKSLTPDGFLTGSCQINRGGETLQKSSYRVISQYVMGLMAHLYTV